MARFVGLLAFFALACGSSSSGETDAGGADAGPSLTCETDETQVDFGCSDLVPEELGGPGCCGDHRAHGCSDGTTTRCPDGYTAECTGFWVGGSCSR
ncbi:MAG: hypothetical protein R3B99_06755 [Polyangiales bacterium]